MNIVQPGREPIKFMTTAETDSNGDRNLLTLKYTRAQQATPDFLTLYEGIDQSIDAQISTVVLRTAPEPILTVYDFIMTTFVPKTTPLPAPESGDLKASASNLNVSSVELQQNAPVMSPSVIRVMAKLASVQRMSPFVAAYRSLMSLLQ